MAIRELSHANNRIRQDSFNALGCFAAKRLGRGRKEREVITAERAASRIVTTDEVLTE
jgi:hypothetical protein